MNKRVKKLVAFSLIFGMCMGFAGCSSSGTSDTSKSISKSSNNAAKEKISIQDIPWNVDEGIVDGTRFVLFDYTNNSKYPITELKISFKEKSGLTADEKNKFYSFIQSETDASDKDMEEYKEVPISMHADVKKVVDPGDSASNNKMCYYQGYRYVMDISHYNMVEPDIVTIKYVDGDEIHTEYYDYRSKKYNNESKTQIAYQWSDKDLGSKIPKPEVKVVELSNDSERYYSFTAYGMSLEQFNDYVKKCEEHGYTVDVDRDEGYYIAYNNEGYRILLDYNEDNCSMSGSVDAPSTEGK